MKIGVQRNFENPLLLLQPSLMKFGGLNISGHVTIANRFTTFLIEALSRHECFDVAVIDGACLKISDFRSTRINLLRALMNRNEQMQFFIFSDQSIKQFDFRSPNLIVVGKSLTNKNIKTEIQRILTASFGNYHKAHSVN